MTGSAKVLWTALLFAASVILVAVAALTEAYWPLFAAAAPLLVVPWVLARSGGGGAATPADTADEPPPEPPEPPGHQPQERA